MMTQFTPEAWFWFVGGDESRAWSSASGGWVTELPEEAGVTRIFNAQELSDALAENGLPGPIARPYRVYRVQFVERMEPEEATALETALSSAAEPKLRMMYQSVDYFLSDDPLFAVLHWTVAVALGSEGAPNFARADTLLAASD